MPVAGRDVTVYNGSVPTATPTPTQTQTTEVPVGSIVGGLLGGIAIAVFIGLVWLWWERRQTQWPKLPERESSRRPSGHYTKRVSFTVTKWGEDDPIDKTDDAAQGRAPTEVTVIERPVELPEPSWLKRPSPLERLRATHAPTKPSPLATHSPIIASPLPSTPSATSPTSPISPTVTSPMLARRSIDPTRPSMTAAPPMYYQDDGWIPPDPMYGPYSSADAYAAYKLQREIASRESGQQAATRETDQQDPQVKVARRISRKPVPSIDGHHDVVPPVPS